MRGPCVGWICLLASASSSLLRINEQRAVAAVGTMVNSPAPGLCVVFAALVLVQWTPVGAEVAGDTCTAGSEGDVVICAPADTGYACVNGTCAFCPLNSEHPYFDNDWSCGLWQLLVRQCGAHAASACVRGRLRESGAEGQATSPSRSSWLEQAQGFCARTARR